MPSPTCQVKEDAGAYQPTANGVDVAAASTVTINLVSSSGVRSWTIECVGTDDDSDAAAINAALSINQVAKTAVFTAPSAGHGYIFRSTVNGGVDLNGTAQASYSTTFGIWVLTAGGRRVIAVNEQLESNEIFGWIADINGLIRNPSPGSGEANTTSNVGAGAQLAKAKSGVDFPFRTVVGLNSTAIAQLTDTVTVDADGIAPLANSDTGSINNLTTTSSGFTPTVIRFSGAAPSLTGLASGAHGRKLWLVATGGDLTLNHESGSSTAANRIVTSTAANMTVPNGAAAQLVYDGTSSRWRVASIGASASIAAGNRGEVYETFDSGSGPAVRWGNRDAGVLSNSGTGTINNVATVDANNNPVGLIRFTGNGTPTVLTGLAGGYAGRQLALVNLTAGNRLTIPYASVSSSAGNRIEGTGATGLDVPEGGGVLLRYDSVDSVWQVIATTFDADGTITVTNSSTGSINDVATTNSGGAPADVMRFTGTSTITVSGFASGTSNRRITVWNTDDPDTTELILLHESASSSASNRIVCPNGDAVTIRYRESVDLIYDSNASRWRVILPRRFPLGIVVTETASQTLTGKTYSEPVVTGTLTHNTGGFSGQKKEYGSLFTRSAASLYTITVDTLVDERTVLVEATVISSRHTTASDRSCHKIWALINRNGGSATVIDSGAIFESNTPVHTVAIGVSGNDARIEITPANADLTYWQVFVTYQGCGP